MPQVESSGRKNYLAIQQNLTPLNGQVAMLAGTVESLVLSLSINTCCCCVDHRLGSALLGIAHLTLSVCFLVVNVVWTVTMSKENVCYGPIAIPEDQDCYENLNKSSSQLAREIIAIFNYAQVFITV